jgi:D-alanine-D-alanine ligase
MSRIRVGLLCGGQSAEHEVSLQSVQNIIDALDTTRFDVVVIAIDKNGRWYLCDSGQFLRHAHDPSRVTLRAEGLERVMLPPWSSPGFISAKSGQLRAQVDVLFPVLHGPYGEDGTIQGMLKLSQVPFVGAGVLASALTMDKVFAKRLLREAGIPHAAGRGIHRDENPSFQEFETAYGLPLFVKPANLGSSVGISVVSNAADFSEALENAFRYDHMVVVEEAIAGKEVECGVLGDTSPIASVVGQVEPKHGFYSYEAKYLDPDGAKLRIPADISNQEAECVRRLSLESFQLFGCSGLARVDFFVREGQVILNEINTLPGFTRISMYPRLWEASGVPYSELITRLLENAIERASRDSQLQKTL